MEENCEHEREAALFIYLFILGLITAQVENETVLIARQGKMFHEDVGCRNNYGQNNSS